MVSSREENISLAERLSTGKNLAELQYAKLLYESLLINSTTENERRHYSSIARKMEADLSGR